MNTSTSPETSKIDTNNIDPNNNNNSDNGKTNSNTNNGNDNVKQINNKVKNTEQEGSKNNNDVKSEPEPETKPSEEKRIKSSKEKIEKSRNPSQSSEEEMKRRSATPPSLSSSFKILPPIKKEESLEDKPVESFDFDDQGDLSDFCQVRLRNFSSRTLDLMLLEMRKMDRDREKIIHPATVENLVHKYNLPITPCLDNLLERFEDKKFGGLVNYEDLMRYLQEQKHSANKSTSDKKHLEEYFKEPQQKPRDATVTIRKGRTEPRPGSKKKNRKRSSSWTDERESSLVTDLASALGDQWRLVERLGEVMRSKDHYGNDQLSGQQIQDSLRQTGLRLGRGVVTQWMKSADIIGKGIFSIPVMLETLTKAARIAENGEDTKQGSRRHNSDLSRSSGNLNHHQHHYHPQDDTWKHILDLNSSIPRQKSKSSGDDREVRLKNVMRLKSAMYSSYNQHQGYLPPKDVVQLSLAYSTVFHLKLDLDNLRDAVQRCLGGPNSWVHIESFIKYILDVVL